MKKIFGLAVFTALLMLLFPASALADSFDLSTGAVVIDTVPPTSMNLSIINAGVVTFSTVRSITITSDVVYTLNDTELIFISSSFANLESLDIASTVSYDADGDSIPGDVISGFCMGRTALESVSMPSAIVFDASAFMGCTSLIDIYLPNTTTFGLQSFLGCTSLSSVPLPLATTFGGYCFTQCTSLVSISLPLAATFGDYCFSLCTSLENVNLPSVESLGTAAFFGCTSLESLTLPALKTVDHGFLAGCTSLKTVYLPLLTSSLSSMFYECTSLESAYMPQMTSIGDNILFNCSQPVELIFGSTVPTVSTNVFDGYTMNAASKISVPELAYISYDNDSADTAGALNDDMWFGWTLERITEPVVVNPSTTERNAGYIWLLVILPVAAGIYFFKRRKQTAN